jgi:hypothetical protein
MSKSKFSVKWEYFFDDAFFDMWAVRPIGDKDFNSPRLFHFILKEDAENLKDLLNQSHCAIPKTK